MTDLAGTPPADLAHLVPDRWTEPFWAQARVHRLVCAQCVECSTFRMPPTPFCHVCRSQATSYTELAGTGTVYSFTVVRHAAIPELRDSVPYVVAVVALDDAPGVRMIANIIDVAPNDVTIGMPLQLVWDDVSEEASIPRFVPAAAT